jgi:hypothetical protein
MTTSYDYDAPLDEYGNYIFYVKVWVFNFLYMVLNKLSNSYLQNHRKFKSTQMGAFETTACDFEVNGENSYSWEYFYL